MTTNISEHQVRVYLYAKAVADWFTIQDLSTDTNVPDNSAKRHAERFEELGIFKRLRVAPNHLFRLIQVHDENALELIQRIEEAAPVFEARRKSWLIREASVVGMNGSPTAHDAQGLGSSEDAPQLVPLVSAKLATPEVPAVVDHENRGAKVDLLFALISRPEGATLQELSATLGNQPHSVRATISVKSRERGIRVRCESGRYFLA
jgi:hypothetical protein